jgi:hypothetical protein
MLTHSVSLSNDCIGILLNVGDNFTLDFGGFLVSLGALFLAPAMLCPHVHELEEDDGRESP